MCHLKFIYNGITPTEILSSSIINRTTQGHAQAFRTEIQKVNVDYTITTNDHSILLM